MNPVFLHRDMCSCMLPIPLHANVLNQRFKMAVMVIFYSLTRMTPTVDVKVFFTEIMYNLSEFRACVANYSQLLPHQSLSQYL